MDASRESGSVGFGKAVAFGLVACVVYGVGAGIRSDIGILVEPLGRHCGLAYDQVSFCIAVLQLVFGVSQPAFGLLAARRSNRFVLLCGAGLLLAGLVGVAFAHSFAALFVFLGVVFALGAGAVSFGLVLASAVNFVGPAMAMVVSGMLNAAAGMVGFALSPTMQALLDSYGLIPTLAALGGLVAVVVPCIFAVTSRDGSARGRDGHEEPLAVSGLVRKALGSKTYRCLLVGFATCGFHMVIIESHLFSQFTLYGLDATNASWAFSLYGIATIVGALLSGWLSSRMPKGKLLAFYYGFRAAWVGCYVLLAPKNLVTAFAFSIGLGLSGDATVSPTSGLVTESFRRSEVATLIGALFLVHQFGAFCSASLGGVIRQATGGYALLWAVDVALCLAACVASSRIPAADAMSLDSRTTAA
jgi:MFS family permease